jgi:hypothetical protein
MNRLQGIFARLVVLSLACVGFVAAVPAATAHSCSAQDPATACGNCTEGDHDHRYDNNVPYCQSNDDACSAIPQQITRALRQFSCPA